MDIRKHFEYNPAIDVTAAHIGINKWDWETIDSENEEEALKIMKANRWDVLPIKNEDNTFTKYFSTREWNNYEKLNLNIIQESQKIYYRSSLRDLIRMFNKEHRHYYFLTDYNQILGLVSFVNINCQMVYNYLFQVISDIERSIAKLLEENIPQDDILLEFSNSSDKHLKKIKKKFDEAIQKNRDNTIFEHMYLQTLGITLKKFLNRLPDNKKKLWKFSSKFGSEGIYNTIRQTIAHPVRPILNDKSTLAKLDELLADYIEIKKIIK